ncbi:MAG: class I SAM-dependent methyltransferase [Betaproteobacteria bacterium]|nr:class I SAM-dependent methyltransferase [Betaproteobacteria bacterium]
MQTRRRVLQTLPGALVAAALPGCAQQPATAAAGEIDAALRAAVDGAHRSPANRARDPWRHPLETLAFFGLQPAHTVVELQPGGGWYSEILAPYMRERGRYFAAHFAADTTNAYQRRARAGFVARMAQAPAVYDRATLGTLPAAAGFTDIGPPGSFDLVLTFRNVHNWLGDGSLDATLRACHALLKPGGTLGVVDHRAAPGTALETMKKSGYVTEALMEERARAARFTLAAKSEINANPRDSRDHLGGVWSLPPTLSGKDVRREHFLAIGESDRFTHRYTRPLA